MGLIILIILILLLLGAFRQAVTGTATAAGLIVIILVVLAILYLSGHLRPRLEDSRFPEARFTDVALQIDVTLCGRETRRVFVAAFDRRRWRRRSGQIVGSLRFP
jgi:hypothetical protein